MSRSLVQAARWAVFWLAVLAMNFPVIATFVTSIKSDAEISANASLWVDAPTLTNYRAIFTSCGTASPRLRSGRRLR